MRVVDGSANPELIPDSTAYRLFFVSVAESPNPSLEEQARHKAHLGRVHLNDTDHVTLVGTLKKFKTQYDDLVRTYNDGGHEQGRTPAEYAAFLQQREALVQSTRDELKLALAPQGISALHAFIQGEKSRMRIQLPPAPANPQ